MDVPTETRQRTDLTDYRAAERTSAAQQMAYHSSKLTGEHAVFIERP